MSSKNKRLILGPKSEKQRKFLMNDSVDILLYGGGRKCASTLKHSLKR